MMATKNSSNNERCDFTKKTISSAKKVNGIA